MIVNRRKQGYAGGWIYLWRGGVLMTMTLMLMLLMMTTVLMMTLTAKNDRQNDRRDPCKMQKVDFF